MWPMCQCLHHADLAYIKLPCKNLMLSDVEKGNNLMLTRLSDPCGKPKLREPAVV